jgi:MerR family copper efflux transcriptional regulator
MQIAALENASGLSRETIRYYEKQGLISAPRRNASGYREYDQHTLFELYFVRKAKWFGFSLDEIKVAIPKLRNPPEQCQALHAALMEKRAEIQAAFIEQEKKLASIEALMSKLGALPALQKTSE